MDDDSPPEAQFRSESTTVNHGSAPYAGAFFPRSRNFTVSGSTFISNNYNEHAIPPDDFRRIPLGDIDLRNEIHFHKESGVIHYQRSRGTVRRMYSAKIDGRKSNMTVALYEGDNAEEEWRDTITKYSCLRHPNFLQIFAVANSAGIHAIVAHDDLIPFYDFLKPYHESPVLTVYIYASWNRDRRDANSYTIHMFGDSLSHSNPTYWIRRSTSRLCVDLTPGDVVAPSFYSHEWTPSSDHIPPLNDANSEAIVVDSLDLGDYHEVCYYHLGHWETFLVSMQAELHLGAVVYSPSGSELDSSVEITFLPDANLDIRSWFNHKVVGDTMEDGWTRYNSAEIFGITILSSVYLEEGDWMPWLSQANHIFHRLQIKSNYENYAIIDYIYFRLRILEPTQTPPKGYLFICPSKDLKTGPSSLQWPDCPAYWSLEPSGTERLNTDEATHLGFPSIDVEAEVRTVSWDDSVYAGLHKFHEGKGFDPDSQDVARHLGEPLYKLSPDEDAPFAHMDEVSNGEAETEGGSTATTEDEDEDEDGPTSEHVDPEVSDVEAEREGSSTANTEDEVEAGSASEGGACNQQPCPCHPTTVDAEIAELHAESEGSCPATNEDEDCDELTLQDDHSVTDVELSWSWKAIMSVKLGLILALGFNSLCEYGRAVLSQRDI